MSFTKARGDRMVALGSLGEVHCRPGFAALEAIDDPDGRGSLTVRARRLVESPSISDIVDVLYQTHLNAASDDNRTNTFTRDQIGAAVVEVKINSVRDDCVRLIASAFAQIEDDDAGEEASGGNPQKAGTP